MWPSFDARDERFRVLTVVCIGMLVNRYSQPSSNIKKEAFKLCHFIDDISDIHIVSPRFSAARQTFIFSFAEREPPA